MNFDLCLQLEQRPWWAVRKVSSSSFGPPSELQKDDKMSLAALARLLPVLDCVLGAADLRSGSFYAVGIQMHLPIGRGQSLPMTSCTESWASYNAHRSALYTRKAGGRLPSLWQRHTPGCLQAPPSRALSACVNYRSELGWGCAKAKPPHSFPWDSYSTHC